MPRGKRNWTFKQVQSFLLAHGFILHHVRGSHHYFRGFHSGKLWSTHIQYHGSKAIHPRTLASVIRQSGIPEKEWLSS